MELSLGTVQLGLHYGVNNDTGALTDEQADAVLDAAADAGFTMVDTSVDYGLAIERIARFLRRRPGALEVVAKFFGGLSKEEIWKQSENALQTLGTIDYTLLWTAGQDIASLDPAYADGVTVYTVDEAEDVPEDFGIVQVPASILDGRMDEEIPRLQAQGRTVIVRSLLLQGLLAADPNDGPVGHHQCPALADTARPYLQELRSLATTYKMSVIELAVRWVWEIDPDVAVLGAETPDQVREIATAWKRGPLPREVVHVAHAIREDIPAVVISPLMWGQQFDFTMSTPG